MVVDGGRSRDSIPPGLVRVCALGADGTSYDVFDLVTYDDSKLVVRGPLMFEVGEVLRLKVERDGNVSELKVRVDSHTGSGDDVLTAITVVETLPVKRMVSG
jgi:hypothetical protein